MLVRANGVIDHYLNGPGSYWDAGTRKPLQKTIRDLKDFKNRVIASKPMSFHPVQPPIFGFPEQAGSGDEDWLLQLLAPRGRR
jgi:hypothetical protein